MSTPTDAQGTPAPGALQSLTFQMLHFLPRNALSRAVGRLSDTWLPRSLRPTAYQIFADLSGAKLEEAELPLEEYPSVNAFFTRRLRPGLRPIDDTPRGLVSPADGVVSAMGRIEDGKMMQIKGRMYEARELLGGHHDALPFEDGHYITIYLSPTDYPRVHHPVTGQVRGFTYNPGHLWPVNAAAVHNVDRLFCVNERVCVYVDGFDDGESGGEGLHGYNGVPVASVMVGATCVGRMSLSFDPLVTNTTPGAIRQNVLYADGKPVRGGDEMGMFNLGSTVVLLIGAKELEWAEGIYSGQKVQMGQALCTVP